MHLYLESIVDTTTRYFDIVGPKPSFFDNRLEGLFNFADTNLDKPFEAFELEHPCGGGAEKVCGAACDCELGRFSISAMRC